jgi:hypothetical protein
VTKEPASRADVTARFKSPNLVYGTVTKPNTNPVTRWFKPEISGNAEILKAPNGATGPVKFCPDPKPLSQSGTAVADPPCVVGKYAADARSRLIPEYVENAQEAGKYFEKNFANKDVTTKQLLEDMHRLSATGENGNRPFEVPGARGYNSGEQHPGQIRPPGEGPIYERSKVTGPEMAKLYSDALKSGQKPVPDAEGRLTYKVPMVGEPQIPEEGWPRVRITPPPIGPAVEQIYPDGKFMGDYIKRMDALRTQIQAELAKSNNGQPNEKALKLISEYYRVGIASHMFQRTNQSMMMNQVNSMLKQAGYPEQMHDSLDLKAISMSGEQFHNELKSTIASGTNDACQYKGPAAPAAAETPKQ